MNFYEACQVLEIDSHEIYEICNEPKSLKRQYTKLALKYHPDKSQKDTTAKFQDIQEAYKYLNQHSVYDTNQETDDDEYQNGEDNDSTDSQTPLSYISLFKCFMGTLDDPITSKYLDIIGSKILNVCEHQAIQMINKLESSRKFFVIYNILTKYKHVFHLSPSFYHMMEQKRIFWFEQSKLGHRRLAENLTKQNPYSCSDFDFDFDSDFEHQDTNDKMTETTEPREPTEKEIFENHYKPSYDSSDDETIDKLVLQPTLNDLWENNVYKYTKNGKTILVPLWHHELIYDIDDNDFVIKMKPKLPSSNYWIDEQNNLHQLQEYTVSELWDHVVDETPIHAFFGKKRFILYPHKLSLKTHQKWVWDNEGLTQIQNDSIYDISQKADVILHIHLRSAI
jgi:hypothetical protein